MGLAAAVREIAAGRFPEGSRLLVNVTGGTAESAGQVTARTRDRYGRGAAVTPPRASGVRLKDVTLREGLDTPGVDFTPAARARILRALDRAGIEEAEVVAPARVAKDLARARSLPRGTICLSGLVYATTAGVEDEIARCAEVLDRVDVLMPLSSHRPPAAPAAKVRQLTSALRRAARAGIELGAGFPHAFTVDRRLLLAIASAAADSGARRMTLYDTSGAAEPFALHDSVAEIVESIALPIFFHGHDDLGLATANAWAAARAGASGLDVTVNGLGDRAGNVSLEQAAMLLRAHGVRRRCGSRRSGPWRASSHVKAKFPSRLLRPSWARTHSRTVRRRTCPAHENSKRSTPHSSAQRVAS